VVIAVAAYAALFVIGWPIWDILGGPRTRLSTVAGAPVAGLALAQVIAWYGRARAPLGDLAWVALLVPAAVSLALVLRRRPWRDARMERPALVSIVVAGGGAALSFVVEHRNVFQHGRQATGEFVTADMVYYALNALHLRDQGLAAGQSGANGLAQITLRSTPGAYVLPAYLTRWTGLSMSAVALPIALVLVVVVALAARDLALTLLPDRQLLGAFIAVSSVSVALFVFSTGAYPLSQLTGQVSVVAMVVLLVDAVRSRDREGVVRAAALGAVVWTPLLMSYPHMAVLGAPVVVVTAVGAAWRRPWRQSLPALVGAGAGVAVLLSVTLPSRVGHAFSYAFFLQDASAGFPIGRVGPLGLLGLQSSFPPRSPSAATLVLGGVVLVAIVAAGWVHRSQSPWRIGLAVTCVLVPLGSYLVAYQIEGYSYQQWKWIAFFVPLVVVGVLALAVTAVLRSGRESTQWPWGARTPLVAGVALLALLGAQLGLAYEASHQIWFNIPTHDGWYILRPDLRTVASGPAYQGVRSVDVDLPDAWQNGWAAEALIPRRVSFQGPAYFSTSEPTAAWTLERADQPGIHPPGSESRAVNSTYRLVRDATREPVGTLWVVANCAGLYRFDGRRWVALERTPGSGEFRLRITAAPRRPGTRAPLLVRSTQASLGVDALQLEYLPGNRARIVLQHGVATYGAETVTEVGDRRGRRGPTFALPAGQKLDLDAVFDPLTGEVRVTSGGASLLDTTVRFFEPHQGSTLVGRNVTTRYLQHGGTSTARFTGMIQVLPASAPQCLALHAAGRL
jgi:hypothetical protein